MEDLRNGLLYLQVEHMFADMGTNDLDIEAVTVSSR
jgi:hypothetical protein